VATYEAEYGSFVDYVDYCKNAERTGEWRDQNSSTKNSTDESWDLGAGYEGAFDLAYTGWREGCERFAGKIMDAYVSGKVESLQPMDNYEASVAGFHVLMGAVMTGSPCNMLSVEEGGGHVPSPAVTINIGYGFVWTAVADHIANWGAAICLLIQELENKNRPVRLNLVALQKGDKDDSKTTVQLKRAGEPLDIDKVAFALAHPAALRRIWFKWLEASGAPRKGFEGYGTPCTAPEVHIPAIYTIDKGDQSKHCTNMDDAIARVRELWEDSQEAK
tara:strand:+ start:1049 stop:1873 length:825 start_codon:yes stop_codon:yes gene_type:complete